MADKIQNGQAEYGVIHVMENEMREAGQGVFEPKSSETRKTAKASDSKVISAESMTAKPAKATTRKAPAKK